MNLGEKKLRVAQSGFLPHVEQEVGIDLPYISWQVLKMRQVLHSDVELIYQILSESDRHESLSWFASYQFLRNSHGKSTAVCVCSL